MSNEPDASSAPPNKGDVLNRLIERFGLARYLEYNKFDGGSFYDDIVCEHKQRAYVPEQAVLDGSNLRRLLEAAKGAELDAIVPIDGLLARCGDARFDIIFFDPVHVRPDVDRALQMLPRLLRPGGFLVVHDCNPRDFALTTVQRKPGSWVGETYKAFAVFRAHNRAQAITVDEDFGVGIVRNLHLDLDYPTEVDLDYFAFAEQRQEYAGLMAYDEFLARTADGDAALLFAQEPATVAVQLLALAPGAPGGRTPSPFAPAAAGPVNSARSGHAQLFWRSAGAPFTERHSRECPIRFDGKEQCLRFLVTDIESPLAQLRFDFADSLGAARLDAFVLRDAQGRMQWQWDGSAGSLKDVANLALVETPSPARQLFLLARNADPSLDPSPSAEVLARSRAGWSVEVRITPLPDYLQDPLAELVASRAAQAALQARVDALEKRVEDGDSDKP